MKILRNFLIDLVIFAGFLLAFEPHITGDSIHEWLGLGLFVTAMIHLLIHWRWVANAVKKFFARMPFKTRIDSIVDWMIFVGFVVMTWSGVMISRTVLSTLGISLPGGGDWRQLHSLSAEISLYLVALHFALHWSWVAGVLRKYVGNPVKRLFQRQPELASVPVKIDKDL